ncbi:hypothetical protein BX616_008137, partial [Lobosporangium transversale]
TAMLPHSNSPTQTTPLKQPHLNGLAQTAVLKQSHSHSRTPLERPHSNGLAQTASLKRPRSNGLAKATRLLHLKALPEQPDSLKQPQGMMTEPSLHGVL